jgi:ubiquinone/menaquinone biosynthesis C-methylase UbiE
LSNPGRRRKPQPRDDLSAGGSGSAVAKQRDYHARTAAAYDISHEGDVEHERAIRLLLAWLPLIGARTALDICAGTGRLQRLAAELGAPRDITGVESVGALRAEASRRQSS